MTKDLTEREAVAKAIYEAGPERPQWKTLPENSFGREIAFDEADAAIAAHKAHLSASATDAEAVAVAIWKTKPGSKLHPWPSLGTIRDTYRDEAQAAIDAYRLHLSASGYVIAPRVSTPAMYKAGEDVTRSAWANGHPADADEIWESMLSALPDKEG